MGRWGGVNASTLGSSAAGPQPRGPRACPPPVSPPRLGSFSKSFSYSPGLSASPSFGGFLRHLSHSCLQLAHESPTLSGGLAVWVSPEISPWALPLAHAHVRAPSLPVYMCTLVFFSPESLISALSLSRVCVCVRAGALPVFSDCLTLVPHSGVCPYFSDPRQHVRAVCPLPVCPSLTSVSVAPLSPAYSRSASPPQFLSLLSPAHFLRGCVRASARRDASASRRLSLGFVPVSPSVSF